MKILALQTYQSAKFCNKQETHFNDKKMPGLQMDYSQNGNYVRIRSKDGSSDIIVFAANIAYAEVGDIPEAKKAK
jgi:predicted ATP-dependent Lon-type protease